jgi:hypothetical protein
MALGALRSDIGCQVPAPSSLSAKRHQDADFPRKTPKAPAVAGGNRCHSACRTVQ